MGGAAIPYRVDMDSSQVRHLVVYFVCLCFLVGVSISGMNRKLPGLPVQIAGHSRFYQRFFGKTCPESLSEGYSTARRLPAYYF